MSKSFQVIVILCAVLSLPSVSNAQPFLYGSDHLGNLSLINTATGAGTAIGQEMNFPLSTEIEFGLGQLYSEEAGTNPNLHTLNASTGLSTGSVMHAPVAFQGMEFVGNTLYVTSSTGGGGMPPSTLEIVNPNTGAQTPIGLTGFGPISGLAYDVPNQTMYGVTAGGGTANLLTINLGTGAATAGPLLLDSAGQNPLTHVGSLEFGSDGVLYGGVLTGKYVADTSSTGQRDIPDPPGRPGRCPRARLDRGIFPHILGLHGQRGIVKQIVSLRYEGNVVVLADEESRKGHRRTEAEER